MNFAKQLKIFVFCLVVFCSFAFVSTARAEGSCFCYTSLSGLGDTITPKDLNDPSKFDSFCYPHTAPECFVGGSKVDKKYNQCAFQVSGNDCEDKKRQWKADWEKELTARLSGKANQGGGEKRKGLIGAILPECVFAPDVKDECRDITIFIKLAIDVAGVVFTIIGSLALGVFIYGGFVLILSEGSPDKIKQGTGAMVAAFIGLAVVFGAYALVRILGEAIGIKEGFNILR